jgi:hypothetical protein
MIGQPVEPVGQVHRIGRADDHDHRERDEESPVDQHVLEDGHRQLAGQLDGMGPHRRRRRRPGDGEADGQAHRADTPLALAFETLA